MLRTHSIYLIVIITILGLNTKAFSKTDHDIIRLSIKSIEKAVRAENTIVLSELFKEDNDLKELSFEQRGYLLAETFCKPFVLTTARGNKKNLLDKLSFKIVKIKEKSIILQVSIFGYAKKKSELEIDFQKFTVDRFYFKYSHFKELLDDLGGKI